MLSGLKWSVLAKLIVQLISWAATFFVIRLLSPEDYGLVEISSVAFSMVNLLTVNGFVSALVKTQDKSPQRANQVFTISLIINTFVRSVCEVRFVTSLKTRIHSSSVIVIRTRG